MDVRTLVRKKNFSAQPASFKTPRPRISHLLEKMVFQSFFMLMTTQPFWFASSINDCGNVPNFVSATHLAAHLLNLIGGFLLKERFFNI